MTVGRWTGDPTVQLVDELPTSPIDDDAIVVVVPNAASLDEAALDEDIARVVERLRGDPRLDAAASLSAVTDAVKRVDDDGRIVETLDRSALGYAAAPMAVRGRAVNTGSIATLGVI